MSIIAWDASALAKRFTQEAGTAVVEAVFENVPTSRMASAYIGYAETAAILRRRLNDGRLGVERFRQARAALREEVLADTRFTLLDVEQDDFLTGIELADRHNLNATDGAVLQVFLTYARTVAPAACVLVASDRRLLRAAGLEGLRTLDPEHVSVSEVPARLSED